MSLVPPIYLTDSSGQQWTVVCSNQAVLSTIPVTGASYAPSRIFVNSITDNSSWAVSVAGPVPPSGSAQGALITLAAPQGDYPPGIPVAAPNGTIYQIQVATVAPPIVGQAAAGVIQVALPSQAYNCDTPIGTLAANVLERLEDPTGIFWNTQYEIYSGIVEAMNDLLLLVGRPTQIVGMPFNLQMNSVWQQMPKGVFLVSDVWGGQSRLRKNTLFSYDYEQPGNIGSDWENDTSAGGPVSWAPVGMGMFVVHPAPSVPQTVLLDGLAYPVAESAFPYTGGEIVPFPHEWYVILEEYAAHYARIKEGSAEFQESMSLYQGYLAGAKRYTEIQDRRDPLVFSRSFGAPAGVNHHVSR